MISILRYIGFVICLISTVLIFFPISILRPFNTKNSYLFFSNFRRACSWFLGIELHVNGYEKILKNRPSVIVANHQHTFDILVTAGLFTPFLTTLGKFELIFLPIVGQFYALGDNILIKRKNSTEARKTMDAAEQKLKTKKLSVLIFPEGHRNPLPQLTSFKKGAFRTAINTSFPIIPVAISQYRHLESFNKFRRAHIYIEVLDPITTKDLDMTQIEELMNQSRSSMIKAVDKLNTRYHQ